MSSKVLMNYKIGNSDPTLWRDTGAGIWNTEPATIESRVKKALMVNQMPNAAILVGTNAAKHLLHYLGNTGADLMIDLAGMIANVAYAKALFESEFKEAREFAQTLGPGEWQITSAKFSPGYNIPGERRDWFFAVGGYQAWGKATVRVPPADSSSRKFSMDFEYCFFDQYNWNKGIGVPLAGIKITDESMGRFHRQGIAREFEMRGSYRSTVEWSIGSTPVLTGVMQQQNLDLALGRGLWHNGNL
jgi:hypothetical protein